MQNLYACLVILLLVLTGCTSLPTQHNTANDLPTQHNNASTGSEDCLPTEYYAVDHGVALAEHALVICDGSENINNYTIIDDNEPVALIPEGGVHALYLRTLAEWPLPEQLAADTVAIFAGRCSLDSACLVEANANGKPAETNRRTFTMKKLDPYTLKLEYTLPEDQPLQVGISLNFCQMWPSDQTCRDTGNVTVRRGYMFRYESIRHITPADQDPDAECNC